MKKISLSFCAATLAFAPLAALAADDMAGMPGMEQHHETTTPPQFAASIKAGGELHAGQPTPMVLTLTEAATSKPATEEEIKIAHTRRVHLLVVDPSLADYQHIHPTPGKNGEWSFTFTPKLDGAYHVWVDVTATATGKQQYVKLDIGTPLKTPPAIDQTLNSTVNVEGYRFTLKFYGPLKANEAAMGSVTVADKNGAPVTALQPVMGAYAHIVGFGVDGDSIMHIHPLGKEPTTDSARGGPKLAFHIEPEKSGFVKLFVQTKIDDKNIFAPFGVMVK